MQGTEAFGWCAATMHRLCSSALADRTGIIAALVLGLAGVPDDDDDDDRSLSAEGLVRRITAEGAPPWMSPDDLASGRALATLARPETMIELLRIVRRDYGGVAPYLHSVGVTAEEMNRIRQSLVQLDKDA